MTEQKKISLISNLLLKRYPEQESKSTLQAWDSADEYLLDTFLNLDKTSGRILLINDSFGALTCALNAFNPVNISDSYISQQAAKLNLQRNHLTEDTCEFIDCLMSFPPKPAVVLIKIPKTLALLEFQLYQLSQVVTPETIIIAGAKTQDIHTSTLQLFEKWLGPTKTSLAKKKSRLIFCQPTREERDELVPLLSWPLESTNYQIANYPSVFSRSSLDIGARFFMAHLPIGLEGKIADLGCGNGVIGLIALEQNPQASLLFTDESYMAVESAGYNIAFNRKADFGRCQFIVDNSLSQQTAGSLQAVLCNPPFHQQNVITDHIARQMFNDAKRCLDKGGELRIIGNRHLGYHHYLRKLFGNCETLASNNKFVILKSIKVS